MNIENPKPKKQMSGWVMLVLFFAVMAIILIVADSYKQKAASSKYEKDSTSSEPKYLAGRIQLNIADIAIKKKKDVDEILGKSVRIGTWRDRRAGCEGGCPKYSYKDGTIEIIYINGVADRITYTPENLIELNSADALAALGFPDQQPLPNDAAGLRWRDVYGLREILAASNGKGGIAYFLVMSIAE